MGTELAGVPADEVLVVVAGAAADLAGGLEKPEGLEAAGLAAALPMDMGTAVIFPPLLLFVQSTLTAPCRLMLS